MNERGGVKASDSVDFEISTRVQNTINTIPGIISLTQHSFQIEGHFESPQYLRRLGAKFQFFS